MTYLYIEELPEPYSKYRSFAVTYGISHLAYGATPQEALDTYIRLFNIQ